MENVKDNRLHYSPPEIIEIGAMLDLTLGSGEIHCDSPCSTAHAIVT
jgi:hypothetical protein